MLIAGEPGIGNTRLVAEVSARTVWATCWDGDGVPAYWPWRQLDRAVSEVDGPAMAGAVAGLSIGRPSARAGAMPASSCLRKDNGAEIDDLSDVITDGDTVPTTTDYGTECRLGPAEVTATHRAGLAQGSVTYNSVTKPLTTTAPVV